MVKGAEGAGGIEPGKDAGAGETRTSVVAWHELSTAQQGAAMARFEQMRPCLEEGVSISAQARVLQVPLKTVQRWVRRYRAMGLVGLAHQTRADRGCRRSISAECVQLIEGMAFARPEWSRATVHREVCKIARREHWAEPSYGQVSSIVSSLSAEHVTWAREGSKVYQERYDVLYLREVERPNEWWQCDHCWLNIWLRTPDGRSARPYLTVIVDEYSRMVVGYRLSFERPSAYTTGLVLRQAILGKEDPAWPVGGIPEHFYTDHGSDFTSSQLRNVAAVLGMHLVFSQPGRPRGRGKVERFFRTVKQLFLPALPGTFPSERSGYRSARMRRKHQRLLRLTRQRQAELSLEQFDELFGVWLLQEYHHRRHASLKCSPLARWQAACVLVRRPRRAEDVDDLLLRGSKARRVDNKGIVFENRRYQSEQLAGYVHQWVNIRYDPADLSSIAVYQWEGDRQRFVCRATYQGNRNPGEEHVEHISLKALVHARNARRKQVRKLVRERVQNANALLEASGGSVQGGQGKRSQSMAQGRGPGMAPRRGSVGGPTFLQDVPAELLPPEPDKEQM